MNQYKATRKEVESFLKDLKSLINLPTFNPEKDFLLGGKYERAKNTKTLSALDMDREDVIGELKN